MEKLEPKFVFIFYVTLQQKELEFSVIVYNWNCLTF